MFLTMTRSKVLILIFSFLSFFLFFRLWMGSGSFPRIWDMENQIAVLEKSNTDKQERNRKLLAEIEEFRNGDDAVEERARSDFGMVKRGETFYQIILKPDEQESSLQQSLKNSQEQTKE
ncbi:MAG: Cell division protein FtsB [uncultured Thiotrichaceae bacterium]|uniref:Cell division protein FtsB n=1 Tax=uncultured Thiotrichaceae bacterium TaxID=298394 RepID=A0A6S6UHN2_9GAMM|nr:MAG: Cell division protein FtsB [uncultured Thiotrichaceae bacterium]